MSKQLCPLMALLIKNQLKTGAAITDAHVVSKWVLSDFFL